MPPHQSQRLQWPQDAAKSGPLVTLVKSGVAFHWRSRFHNLLEAAEAFDVPVRWSCRSGMCHNCESGVISGELSYSPGPIDTLTSDRRSYLLREPDVRCRIRSVSPVSLLRAPSGEGARSELSFSDDKFMSQASANLRLRHGCLLMEEPVDVIRNFVAVRLEREMARREHIHFEVLQVLLVGLSAWWWEDEILLSQIISVRGWYLRKNS